MALSANLTNLDIRPGEGSGARRIYPKLAGSSTIYNGAAVADGGAGVEPFDGTQTKNIVGFHFGDAVTEDGDDVKVVPGGFGWRGLAVGGTLAVGAAVFMTDDNTFTTTDPTSGQKIGIVTEVEGGGLATVYFFLLPLQGEV